MCDCAEELERKRLAAIRAQSRGTSPPPGSGWLDWIFGDSSGGWFPIIGGSTVFMALLGLVYQNFERIKQFFGGFGAGGKKWKDPCEGQVRKPPPKPFKPCSCDT
ncbi:unnamed protein product [Pieris brassicae]|uniref:Uncharacterized protein n=1 Tax=Pieris brassicae TaxID=7116 RepID=A0A9P0X700_PIEBR|nr:unnamed protein product [Pieris brassicae]